MYVIATAGHVDHGKSTLVRALTGMDPDRLVEEKRRGLTVDLGFAWMTLGKETLAFVDVPGHQRFIPNMLAGIGPVPAVLFVVAADRGWSTQSSEHLAVLEALGVRHGVIAISRSDIGDAELAAEEARDWLSGTLLAGAEMVAVSAVSGSGLSALRAALGRMMSRLPAPSAGRTRMWVDRVFSIRGAGTILTGTLSSGRIARGAPLQLHPGGEVVHIRGIQSLEKDVEHVEAVARVALNLRGIKHREVRRGDTLTAPKEWLDADLLDVRLGRPVTLPAQMMLHLGSAAVPVRTRPLGHDTARLALARAVPVIIGERCLLRDPGSREVLAVTVLDPMPPGFSRRGDATRRAAVLHGLDGQPDLAAEVRRRGAVRHGDLRLIGVPVPADGLPADVFSTGEWLIDSARWSAWRRRLPSLLSDWAAGHPLRPAMPRQAVVDALGAPDLSVVDALVSASDGIVVDGEGVHHADQQAELPPHAERALQDMLAHLALHPFEAPEAPDLRDVGLTPRCLGIAVQEKRLTRVSEGIYLRPDAIDEAVRRLRSLPQPFTMTQAREALETTRRVSVPLLEHLDQRRLTRRVDEQLREVIERSDR